jgi:ribosome maturation factor RimP
MALATEVLNRDDLFVVGVSVRGSKGSRLIEVYVDGDQGVTVTDLAKTSRNLAFALDSDDLIPGKYLLNVSTPGEDRSLLLERQYLRHVGKVLQIQLIHEDGSNRVEGENLGITDGVLSLKTSESEVLELSLDRIAKAKIKLPW